MYLHHGSNIEVQEPKIITPQRNLDFGIGFYTTSNKEQAVRWAQLVTRRRKMGTPTITNFIFDITNLNKLTILKFETANEAWLDFVVLNRTNRNTDSLYDIIIGPVANDTTLTVIDNYIDGTYTKPEAIKRLEPQNLTDQYVFTNKKALDFLQFHSKEELS